MRHFTVVICCLLHLAQAGAVTPYFSACVGVPARKLFASPNEPRFEGVKDWQKKIEQKLGMQPPSPPHPDQASNASGDSFEPVEREASSRSSSSFEPVEDVSISRDNPFASIANKNIAIRAGATQTSKLKQLLPKINSASALPGPQSDLAPADAILMSGVLNPGSRYYGELFNAVVQMPDQLPKGLMPVLVNPSSSLREQLAPSIHSGKIKIVDYAVKHPFVRRYFPEMVVQEDGSVSVVQFHRPVAEADSDALGQEVARQLGASYHFSPLKLDGGNLLIDDKHRLFVTDIVAFQNSKLKASHIEDELKHALSARSVHWIPRLPIEKTGSINLIATYVGNNTMIVGKSLDSLWSPTLDQAAEVFEKEGLRVVRVLNAENPSLDLLEAAQPLTYTGPIIVNEKAFIPTYADTPAPRGLGTGERLQRQQWRQERDDAAAAVYKAAGFEVIRVPSQQLANLDQGPLQGLSKSLPRINAVRKKP